MKLRLTIPVYADHQRAKNGKARFRVKPLFVSDSKIEEHDAREDRALNRLSEKLRNTLAEPFVAPDHRPLLEWTFSPAITEHAFRLRIELRNQSFEGRIFAVVFATAGRRIALLPCGGLSFEWPEGVRLEDSAHSVLTEHLRKLEKEEDEPVDPQQWLCGSQPHVTHLDVTFSGNQRIPRPRSGFLSLGQEKAMDGEQELRKVGRCLDKLYPRDLQRALLREDVIRELMAWFGRKLAHPPAVVLVGRPKSGKTALIHECVRRRYELPDTWKRGQFWLVAPQRVISGMSFLGQWEERWEAMLGELRARRHVLVLDDLPGLFEAGKASGSDLTLGHVLKARMEHEPQAILAEATPESWARMKELDRAFTTHFHVIHVRETGDDATLRILIRTLQTLESNSSTRLSPDVLLLTMRLQQRFGKARAFPGKGVDMLNAVAASFADRFAEDAKPKLESVTSTLVLDWFAQRHGIRLTMIDGSQTLTPSSLREFFATRIMGQQEAVNAMIDTVLMARAEVQDQRRPLGSLLFLGPTGVGKTECARALAEFVFGHEDRMLRFDLNEYSASDAAVRLIGGPGQSGLLTARVRRHPFCLLLFDEIEKAHPDVFDLLLQVLGEGRLTDAQGQTADFCNCIVILTSNLGAQNARRRLGFEEADFEDREVYREAARKFFRPEFFNRIDRIVPFHELRRADIEHLAGVLASKALSRQGLRDRRVDVALDAACVTMLAQKGYDRENGARALRRAVETHLVEPLASALLSGPDSRSLRVRVSMQPSGELHFAPEIYTAIARSAAVAVQWSHDDLLDVLDECHACLDDAVAKLDTWQTGDELTPKRAWYFQLRDEANHLRRQLEKAEDSIIALDDARQRALAQRGGHAFTEPQDETLRVMPPDLLATVLDDALACDLASHAVHELLLRSQTVHRSTGAALRLLWRSRWLSSLAQNEASVAEAWTLRSPAKRWWSRSSMAEIKEVKGARQIEGHGLRDLLTATSGVCLDLSGRLSLTTTSIDQLPPPGSAITRIRHHDLLLDLRTGLCMSTDAEPFEMALAACFGDTLET